MGSSASAGGPFLIKNLKSKQNTANEVCGVLYLTK
jgi:hypothetical protein